MQCSNCGKGLRDGAEFCTTCGTKVVADVSCCPSCAEPAEGADLFCLKCGAALSEEAPPEAAESTLGDRWRAFREGLKPSAETVAVLRDVGITVGILVVMVAVYLAGGWSFSRINQMAGQEMAFLLFVDLFSTLVVLAFAAVLLDEWWQGAAVGACLFIAQYGIGVTILSGDWVHQAFLGAALVLGAYLARRFVMGDEIQAAYDNGKETGRLNELWRRRDEEEAEGAAAEAVVAAAAPAEGVGIEEEEFVLPPLDPEDLADGL